MSDPIIPPTPLPSSPALPQRSDPETFEDRVDAAYEHMFEVLPPGLDALAGNVYDNALAAEQRALTADTRAADAESAQQGAEDARDKAQEWAEGVEPEPGSKSAREWSNKAQEWAESEDAPEPGSKSAKSWAEDSEAAKESAWAAAAAAGEGAGLPSPLVPGRFLGVTGAGSVAWLDGMLQGYQEVTASTLWNKPDGAAWFYIEAIGGGGSGSTVTGTLSQAKTGGTGGEFVGRLLRAQDVPNQLNITVGSGGAPVSGNNNGNDGGDSSFGGLLRAYGGVGGNKGTNVLVGGKRSNLAFATSTGSMNQNFLRPLVGVGVTQSVNIGNEGGNCIYGAAGGAGIDSSEVAGSGGISQFAGDGGASKGAPGEFPGGGGAANNEGGSSGAGASGVIRIWWW